MSDRLVTQDLMTRLERHYIKPGQGFSGGVFVPECGLNGESSGRRCDALYVGFTSTSGRILVGHEVKASRSDWLHELDQIHKADQWADQCHEWWLVTAPDVLHDGELPAGWGHMVPGPSRTRMRVLAKPRRHLERQPSWLVTRSIMARLDTLQVQAMAQHRVDVRKDLQAEHQRELETLRERTQPVDGRVARKAAILDEIEAALGVNFESYRDELFVRPGQFVEAVRVVKARDELTQRWNGAGETVRTMRETADQLERMALALGKVVEASA